MFKLHRESITHHCPSLDAILDHEVLCQRCRHLGHVMSILLLAEARFAVAKNSQAQELAWCVAGRGRGHPIGSVCVGHCWWDN